MLSAENIYKSFGKAQYLKGISLSVDKGACLAIVGQNGAGKTTLMKILATASNPDSGSLYINGIDALQAPQQVRKLIGYVPQSIALMPELSVKDNLYYWMSNKDENIYNEVLELIDLKDVQKKKVKKLSGGMQRRLNVGASLVQRPKLLIMDEPLAGVDLANRKKLLQSFINLKQTGTTLIFTSHYLDGLDWLADKMLALRDGQCTYYGGLSFSDNHDINSLPMAISYYTY